MAIASIFLDLYKSDLDELSIRANDLKEWFYNSETKNKELILEIETFPEILVKSLFLAAYASLEACLSEITSSIYKQNNLTISPDDLRGKGIQRSVNYLKKVVNIPIPDDLKEYEVVLQIMKLRNHYTHDGRPHVLKNSQIHNAAIRFSSLIIEDSIRNRLGEHVRIRLTFEFLQDVFTTIRIFYYSLGLFLEEHLQTSDSMKSPPIIRRKPGP